MGDARVEDGSLSIRTNYYYETKLHKIPQFVFKFNLYLTHSEKGLSLCGIIYAIIV